MGRLNTVAKKTTKSRKVKNYEGSDAYKMGAEMELYTLACASMLKDKFYTKADSEFKRIQELIPKCRAEFVAKLGVYVRENMYLRSVPVVLAVELAKTHHGDNLISRMVNRIVARADEITELLGYYQTSNSRKGTKKLNKLSKQIQKGLAIAFNKFDEYQFAKYNRDTDVKLRDALFLIHPKAKDKNQQDIFNRIASDSLKTPDTWEVKQSKIGQEVKDKTAEEKQIAQRGGWEDMLKSNKMGYMALLRNICNILKYGVDVSLLEKAAERLKDEKQILKSKQLPFRFYSAYKQLVPQSKRNNYWGRTVSVEVDKDVVNSPYVHLFTDALNEALYTSIKNVPLLDEKDIVLIATDSSGSMSSELTPSIAYHEVATLLAVLARKFVKHCTFVGFDTELHECTVGRSKDVLKEVERITSDFQGGATNGWLVLDLAIKNAKKYPYNKIMMFSDLQLWNSAGGDGGWGYSGGYTRNSGLPQLWEQYKKLVPEAELYLFDLTGHGTTPIDTSKKGVFIVSGWSDKVFEMFDAVRKGSSVIEEIMKIAL
jgi:60 kDa SS-A/Ro ribonucleoprotein